MNHVKFVSVMKDWWDFRMGVMGVKSKEYSTDMDKLENLKRAAAIQARARTPKAAAWNMNTKHMISIIDLIEREAAGEVIPLAVWKEKLGDDGNYIDLIYADAVERAGE